MIWFPASRVNRPNRRSLSSIKRPVGAKNLEHHHADRALAGALLAALEDDDDLGVLIRVLHGPGEPANEIPELRLVASADDLPDMPKQPPLLLPAFAGFNSKPAP